MDDFYVPNRYREGAIVCSSCGQTLYHDARFCPNYPDVPGPYLKWSGCVCTVHTCYDASQPRQLTLDDALAAKEQQDLWLYLDPTFKDYVERGGEVITEKYDIELRKVEGFFKGNLT